jgi:hypothetical protein
MAAQLQQRSPPPPPLSLGRSVSCPGGTLRGQPC